MAQEVARTVDDITAIAKERAEKQQQVQDAMRALAKEVAPPLRVEPPAS